MLGTAADFKITGIAPKQIYAAVERLQKKGKMKAGGLHAYSTWVHYDVRGHNARW